MKSSPRALARLLPLALALGACDSPVLSTMAQGPALVARLAPTAAAPPPLASTFAAPPLAPSALAIAPPLAPSALPSAPILAAPVDARTLTTASATPALANASATPAPAAPAPTNTAVALCDQPALAPLLCPERPPATALEARAELLAADSPAAVAALIPRLASAPDLQGIARLVALARLDAPLPAALGDPLLTPVSPLDDAALAQVLLALRLRYAGDAGPTLRTQATALLARAHAEALQLLGLPPQGPWPPFARLLAGRALHYERELASMYWQRRVAGLEDLVRTSESRLLATLIAVEASPYAGDDALLASERHRCRRYVLRSGPRQRLQQAHQGGADPADLLPPFTAELERLIEQEMVDLALERTLAEATTLGLDLAEALLVAAVETHAPLDEQALVRARLQEIRTGENPPPALGTALPRPREPAPWQGAAALAQGLTTGLAGGDERVALAFVLAALRDRPDAARALLDLILPVDASTASPRSDLVRFLPALLARQAADLGPAARRLRQQVAAARLVPSDDRDARETARRRAFALAARARE